MGASDIVVSDFEQCFEQMRHYDDSFQNTVQFAYTGTVAVAGVSGTLLQSYHYTQLNLTILSVILGLSWLAGIILVMSLAKNRVYFAIVARRVNELRNVCFDERSPYRENKAKIYTDPTRPRISDFSSTQFFQVFLTSAFDSFFFTSTVVALVALQMVANHSAPMVDWSLGLRGFAVSLVAQLGLVAVYWKRKEHKHSHGSRKNAPH
jgi:hypothetical protein